jgi:hypothetical protein
MDIEAEGFHHLNSAAVDPEDPICNFFQADSEVKNQESQ